MIRRALKNKEAVVPQQRRRCNRARGRGTLSLRKLCTRPEGRPTWRRVKQAGGSYPRTGHGLNVTTANTTWRSSAVECVAAAARAQRERERERASICPCEGLGANERERTAEYMGGLWVCRAAARHQFTNHIQRRHLQHEQATGPSHTRARRGSNREGGGKLRQRSGRLWVNPQGSRFRNHPEGEKRKQTTKKWRHVRVN